MKLPSSPTYARTKSVPAMRSVARPGFSNCRLCTTKLTIDDGHETQQNVTQGSLRPRRVVVKRRQPLMDLHVNRDVRNPVRDQDRQHPAENRVRRRPKSAAGFESRFTSSAKRDHDAAAD